MANVAQTDGRAGAAIYGPLVLSVYDLWVLGLSNHLSWRCPTSRLVEHYNRHVTGHHLDVGVGTGYLLGHCTFPVATPRLVLADLNPNSLQWTAARVARYSPKMFVVNMLDPIANIGEPFDSIGLNYVLHCLPGPIARKEPALAHLAALLAPTGVLFGATILGRTRKPLLGRMLERAYNEKGVFGNETDDLTSLRAALGKHFAEVETTMEGSVALFDARRPLIRPS
jgi:ubiquinone/menaquinone biosynthesis C-methylase UbiE